MRLTDDATFAKGIYLQIRNIFNEQGEEKKKKASLLSRKHKNPVTTRLPDDMCFSRR